MTPRRSNRPRWKLESEGGGLWAFETLIVTLLVSDKTVLPEVSGTADR